MHLWCVPNAVAPPIRPKYIPIASPMHLQCVPYASQMHLWCVPNTVASPIRPQHITNNSPLHPQCVPSASPNLPNAFPKRPKCISDASPIVRPKYIPIASPIRPQCPLCVSKASQMRLQYARTECATKKWNVGASDAESFGPKKKTKTEEIFTFQRFLSYIAGNREDRRYPHFHNHIASLWYPIDELLKLMVQYWNSPFDTHPLHPQSLYRQNVKESHYLLLIGPTMIACIGAAYYGTSLGTRWSNRKRVGDAGPNGFTLRNCIDCEY